VAAGNDAFAFDLINQCFSGFWGSLGLRQYEFHDLGRADHGWGPVFSMPALALRFSSGRNGVAELHGQTSRRIWNDLWAEVPEEEVPIGHITNGVHLPTWVAPEIQDLVSAHAPADWRERIAEPPVWSGVRDIDPGDLWEVRRQLKAQSVRFLRRRVMRQLDRYEASPTALKDTGDLFDSDALTIGFARRFATYKRATLIFRDLDRLAKLLNDPERPVQLVFAGKAHPADQPGQALIARIHNLSYDPRFAGKILFVEDYDMAIGRALTRGVDVWLNNPRRPLEASGTSGQKAAMNGILNLSILDGWWPEGYNGENGWAIGAGRGFDDDEKADAADADALYSLLEREVVPLYYARNGAGVPTGWMERSLEAIATVSPAFNARRMVRDYVQTAYAPASERHAHMSAQDWTRAKELAAWRKHVHEAFPRVVLSAQPVPDEVRRTGDEIALEAVVNPQSLSRDELCVEVVYTSEDDALREGLHRVPMVAVDDLSDGSVRFRAVFTPAITGRIAYGIRAYPQHELLPSPFDAHAIRWA
jgi:starch phosphorylase